MKSKITASKLLYYPIELVKTYIYIFLCSAWAVIMAPFLAWDVCFYEPNLPVRKNVPIPDAPWNSAESQATRPLGASVCCSVCGGDLAVVGIHSTSDGRGGMMHMLQEDCSQDDS